MMAAQRKIYRGDLSVGKKKASGMCHHSTRPNSTHSFRGKHVNGILPQHVHSLNIEIEAPMKSIIEILKSPNAVLGVLALAQFAQGA